MIHTYIQALKALASDCEFGDTLQDCLLEHFVNGIKSQQLQHKLWANADLTFNTTVALAIQHEVMDFSLTQVVEKVRDPLLPYPW
jgi:hypothetical protein